MDQLILDRAQSAVIARDFGLAARLYKTLLKQEPDNAGFLKALGELYVKSGEDEKAIPYFESMLTFDAHNVGAMNSLGGIYRRLKQYDKSIEVLNRALDENQMTGIINYTLGFTYKDMGNYDDAIDCFEIVVSENPSDVLAYNHLGTIYAAKKDYAKAIQSYRRGLQSDPNHPILQYNLGHAYEAEKNYTEATKCYELALKAKPGWVDAIRDHAKLLIKCQNTRRASEVVRKSIQLYPNNGELVDLQGQVEMARYNFSGAQKYFEKAEKFSPDSAKVLLDKAESYEKDFHIEEAYAYANQAAAFEMNSSLKKKYVHIMLSAGDLQKAAKTIQDLRKENPADVQVVDAVAQYYILRGDDKTAEANFNRIRELNPKYQHYLLEAARRYSQIGKEDKALEFIQKYISLSPKNPAAYNLQGRVYEKKGELENSALAFKKGISLNLENVYGTKESERMDLKLRESCENILEEVPVEVAVPEESPVPEIPEEKEPDPVFDFEQMGGDEKEPEEEPEQESATSFADLYEDEGLSDFKDILNDTDKIMEDEVEKEEKTFDFDAKPEKIAPELLDDILAEEPEPEPEPEKEEKLKDETANRLADAMEDVTDLLADDPIPGWDEPAPKQKPQIDPSKTVDADIDDFLGDDLSSDDAMDMLREDQEPRMDPRLVDKIDDAVENLEKAVSEAEEKASEAIKKAEEAAKRAEELAEKAQAASAELEEPLELNQVSDSDFTTPDFELPSTDNPFTGMPEVQVPESNFAEPDFDSVSQPMNPFEETEPEFTESEAYNTQVAQPVSNAIQEASSFLPNIVKMLENKNQAEEYKQELGLFSKLRGLSNYLPPKQKEEFLSSKTRLLMDYVIGKMSGKPGLVKTVQNLLKSGILDTEIDYESLEKEASTLTGNELAKKVITDLKKLTADLPDQSLAQALSNSADEVLAKL